MSRIVSLKHIAAASCIGLGCLPASSALHAASCQETLPIEERLLSDEEARACLKPKAEVIVALQLLGEKELTWKDFGEVRRKCTKNGEEFLSDDPVIWAAQISSCPSPKFDCGCPPFAMSRFIPETAEASTVRETNIATIKREGAILTKQAFSECEQIRARLSAIEGVKIKRKCKSLR